MYWLALVIAAMLHLGGFFLLFRRLRLFRRERVVLIYHVAAAVAVALWVLTPSLSAGLPEQAVIGMLAFQLTYSLTFLELWSLSQGSYSLQMLALLVRRGGMSRDEAIDELSGIGEEKKRDRLADLMALRLVRHAPDGKVELSGMGRALVWGVRALMRWTNMYAAG